jgi:hypothetical protein
VSISGITLLAGKAVLFIAIGALKYECVNHTEG